MAKRKSKRKSKNIKLAILDSLKEKAPLSTNRGTFDRTPPRKPTPKQRRHRGWRTPEIIHPRMKYSEMIENAWEPEIYYDDWLDFRDGMRDTRKDRTRFIPVLWRGGWWWDLSEEEVKKRNDKLKKQMLVRKAKREKYEKGKKETKY